MIKIEKIDIDIVPESPTYPRVMVYDLNNDELVLAIRYNNYAESESITFISLGESNPSLKEDKSHHFQDFEGSITIRNEK